MRVNLNPHLVCWYVRVNLKPHLSTNLDQIWLALTSPPVPPQYRGEGGTKNNKMKERSKKNPTLHLALNPGAWVG